MVIYRKRGTGIGKKIWFNGYHFDSLPEFRRYQDLCTMERCLEPHITDLLVHPRFIIQDACEVQGEKIPAIMYEADFAYYNLDLGGEKTGLRIVEDVKAFKWNNDKKVPVREAIITQEFALKWKMVKVRYPDCKFVLVES